MRTLVPGCTSFDVERTDDKTLVIQSKAPDIFSCDDVGPIHFAYTFRTCNHPIRVSFRVVRVFRGLTIRFSG
jgi:hypothetical protein